MVDERGRDPRPVGDAGDADLVDPLLGDQLAAAASRIRVRVCSALMPARPARSTSARIRSANQADTGLAGRQRPGRVPARPDSGLHRAHQIHVLVQDLGVEALVDALHQPRDRPGVGLAEAGPVVVGALGPVRADLPDVDLVGVKVDCGVRVDHACSARPRGRPRPARTSASPAAGRSAPSGWTTGCRAAGRRTRPSGRAPRPCSAGSRAGASAPDGRSARGSPRGSSRPRSSSWRAGCRRCPLRRTSPARGSGSARAARRAPRVSSASGFASASRLTNTKPARVSTRAGIRPSFDLSSSA